ncbi:hypothetical protein [Rhodohalobacter sp. 8-1]
MDNSLDELKAEQQLAVGVRNACIEAAVSAIQKLDIAKIVEQHHTK